MKVIQSIIFVFIVTLLLITGCKKEESILYNCNFYTSKTNGKMSLYIDGNFKGDLPYFSKEPECGTPNGDGVMPLILQLPSGEYKIEAKDSTGNMLSTHIIYISKKHSSLSGSGPDGALLSTHDDCMVMGLFE